MGRLNCLFSRSNTIPVQFPLRRNAIGQSVRGGPNLIIFFSFSYFLASSKFLGDQRLAYGQFLHFSLRKLSSYGSWSSQDLQLVGANGRVLSLPLGAQGNPSASNQIQHYQFRIPADPRLQVKIERIQYSELIFYFAKFFK